MFAGKRFGTLGVVALVLAATTIAPSAIASDACADPHGTELTRTFEVKVRADRAAYQVGDRAVFRAKVIRVVDGEPIGPVEGARVGFTASVGDEKVAWGGGVTDAEGKAVIKSRIRAHAHPGWADVWALAEKETADLPCHLEQEKEFGESDFRDLFRTVR